MAHNSPVFVLPRPGRVPAAAAVGPLNGPSEAAFTAVFGTLLPPAQYLQTAKGKAAYYDMPPTASSSSPPTVPDRVLFIHGVQTPALGMLPLAQSLRAAFPAAHLVLFDLWSHGLSNTPVAPHEASLFHDLMDALLDHLGWNSAHLVGYSFGAMLSASYIATRSPSRVQSLTLIAPAGLIRDSWFSEEDKVHFREGCDEEAASKWVLQWLEGGELVVPPDWKERVARGEIVAEAVKEWQIREHPGHMAAVVSMIRDGGVFDNDVVFAKAVQSGIPSLVVLGEKDSLSSEADFRGLGYADVRVVPEVGHGVVRQEPAKVAASIQEFWTKLGES